MQIIQKIIEDLVPYENNPRNNDEAVRYVAESIKEFGFKVPIVIDKNNVIVAGHTRYKASRLLGIKEVPCIIADDLTDDQIRAYRLADNKVSEFATWDFEKMQLEIDELESFDMTLFGFEGGIFLEAMKRKLSRMITKRSYQESLKLNMATCTS